MSRRIADAAIAEGRVQVNSKAAQMGQEVSTDDTVTLDNIAITPAVKRLTLILNKPVGYVASRAGQGSKTIYDLLPAEYHHLKPVGRLDKDSSGLLLLTNDGDLANQLTHPRYAKTKVYEVELDKPLAPEDKAKIEKGIQLEDGNSHLSVTELSQQAATNDKRSTINYRVAMAEGRNRQIRRTFAALGYTVTKLHRTTFGNYMLNDISEGTFKLQDTN